MSRLYRTLGCDPGLSGAVALLNCNGAVARVHTYDMPTHLLPKAGKLRRRLDLHALGHLMTALTADTLDLAMVEDLSGRPSVVRGRDGQPRVQAGQWEQGWNCCAPVAALAMCAVPYTMVRPADWKRRLGVPADKDGARQRASQLLPLDAGQWARVKDDGRAEAALLALYALHQLTGAIAP